jgi:hypothetical protein
MSNLILGLVYALGESIGGYVSHNFGQLYTTAGAGSQTPGTSFVNITQWLSNGLSNGPITPDAANNKITLSAVGKYLVLFQCSFQGTSASLVTLQVELNGVDQTQISCERRLATGTDTGSASAFGCVETTTDDEDLEVHVKCSGGAHVFDLKEGQFIVLRI